MLPGWPWQPPALCAVSVREECKMRAETDMLFSKLNCSRSWARLCTLYDQEQSHI